MAGTIQSRPFVGTNVPSIASQSLAANWLVTNAPITPELGRPLSGGAQTTFVNVVEPGDLYGDRINQVDFRVAKALRFGRTRTNVGLDLFNIFNASPVSTYNQSYVQIGASWLQPTSIIGARIAKLSVRIRFSERRPRRSPSWPDLRDLRVRERSGACVLSCGSAR